MTRISGDRLAIDTSVAVAHLMASHSAHQAAREFLSGVEPCLTAHSLAETYSVLTRLPGDARVAPADAVRLIDSNFGPVALVEPEQERTLHRTLAEANIAGGAVYDALVALAARHNDLPLATRDARALGTYAAMGVTVRLMGA